MSTYPKTEPIADRSNDYTKAQLGESTNLLGFLRVAQVRGDSQKQGQLKRSCIIKKPTPAQAQTHKSCIPTAISRMCGQIDRPEHLQVVLPIEEPPPPAVIYCFHNVGKVPVYLVDFKNFSTLVSCFTTPLLPPPVSYKDFPSRME